MYMNMMMKKGKVFGKKTLDRLLLQRYDEETLREYEFSCSNSPIHAASLSIGFKQRHLYFPSIPIPNFSCINTDPRDQVIEQQQQQICRTSLPKKSEEVVALSADNMASEASKVSVQVTDYSLMQEGHDQIGPWQVDAEAEKFIKWFYEQLRVQGCTLLEHQETEYQEMLARGI